MNLRKLITVIPASLHAAGFVFPSENSASHLGDTDTSAM